MATPFDRVAADFVVAAKHVVAVPEQRPWNYGWSVEEYRRSDAAAIASKKGPVTLSGEGLSAWERAVEALIRQPEVRKRWDSEELFGLMASMTAEAAASDDPSAMVSSALNMVRTAAPALTVLLIANVTWAGPSIEISGMVLGNADDSFLNLVRSVAAGRSAPSREVGQRWLMEQVAPRLRADRPDSVPVALGTWSVGQSAKARAQAERQTRNLMDLCILLETDLPSYGIYRRGPTNRPGVRGLTLDRGAVEAGLTGQYRLELGSIPLAVGTPDLGRSAQWYGAEPLPIAALLNRPAFRAKVAAAFEDDPLSSRLRVAARWFARAHYTSANDDAALALGIAMDALLSGDAALPGSAMADRFAMLEPFPERRRERVKTYLRLYGLRSSVAHGGVSSKLDEQLIKDYMNEVQWAVTRLMSLKRQFSPRNEKEVKDCFDDLRWGALKWQKERPYTDSSN